MNGMLSRESHFITSKSNVWFICLKKRSCILSDLLKERAQHILQKSIDFDYARVPSGICNTCRTLLFNVSNGKKVNVPPLYDFEKIFLPGALTEHHSRDSA